MNFLVIIVQQSPMIYAAKMTYMKEGTWLVLHYFKLCNNYLLSPS